MSDQEDKVETVLDFWFGGELHDPKALDENNKMWFGENDEFDATVRTRFRPLLDRAAAGELRHWKLSARGTLALIITFDQFPRNIYRSTPQAFAFDQRALALCRDGIAMGTDVDLEIIERAFFYLPLEHAEDIEAQEKSVACYERLLADAPGPIKPIAEMNLSHARQHREIIAEYGRFPHRNLVLGRTSTPAEIVWISALRGNFGQVP